MKTGFSLRAETRRAAFLADISPTGRGNWAWRTLWNLGENMRGLIIGSNTFQRPTLNAVIGKMVYRITTWPRPLLSCCGCDITWGRASQTVNLHLWTLTLHRFLCSAVSQSNEKGFVFSCDYKNDHWLLTVERITRGVRSTSARCDVHKVKVKTIKTFKSHKNGTEFRWYRETFLIPDQYKSPTGTQMFFFFI